MPAVASPKGCTSSKHTSTDSDDFCFGNTERCCIRLDFLSKLCCMQPTEGCSRQCKSEPRKAAFNEFLVVFEKQYQEYLSNANM